MNIWSIFDLVAPACLACGLPTSSGALICHPCVRDLPTVTTPCPRCAMPAAGQPDGAPCRHCASTPDFPLTRTLAATAYAFPVDALVRHMKFDARLPVAGALGEVLLAQVRAQRAASTDDAWPDALLPVPLHASRLRERGFNQAEHIARPLARGLGIPLRSDAVVRTRATAAQSRSDLRTRQQNLADAFRVVAPLPAHVAIIDDVVTSGSTLHALAGALLEAGVSRVDAWVVARTP